MRVLSSKKRDTKICEGECKLEKPFREFPRRGNGSLRKECRSCYAATVRAQRAARAKPKWRVSSLPVRINVCDAVTEDWVTSLYGLLKTQGFLKANSHDGSIDIRSLLKRKDKIFELIGADIEPGREVK